MSKIVRLTSKNGTVKQFAVANKVKFDGQISLAKAEVFDPATGKVVPAKIRTTKKKTIISYNDGEREAEIHLQGTVDGSSLGEASSALSTGNSTGAEASFDAPAAGSEASGMPAMAAQEGGFGTTLALGALGLAGLGGVIAAAGASGKTETPQAPRDTTAPIFNASASSPADNSVTAPVGNDIILRFDEAISSSSDLSKVTLKDAAGNTVEAVISLVDGNVVINPAKDLAFGRTYHVEWGAGALRDEAGNAVNAASDAHRRQ